MSESNVTKPNANGQVTSEMSGEEIITVNRMAAMDSAPDPFDPNALRLPQDYASSIGVKKVLTRIRCGKPEKHEFVRIRPGEEWRLQTLVLELKGSQDKPGGDTYLVSPAMASELSNEVRPTVLFTAINRQNVPFLWRCWLPGADGRTNLWTDTMLDAVRIAEESWVRVLAEGSQYAVHVAQGNLPEPEWPDLSLQELLTLAFKDRFIQSPDHPVVRSLRGLA